MGRLGAALICAAAALAVVAAPSSRAEEVSTVCSFSDDRLPEISGMTLSLRHPDVLWLHNDSSGGPYIYAVSATDCRTIARVTIADIEARDIEAIASGRDQQGRAVIWIADIGDNLDSWPEVRLHRIREPRRLVDQEVTSQTYRFTYRDRPHNAEAILADPNSSQLWVVTKQLARGRIYRLPKSLSETRVNIARPVGKVGGFVTDGAVSPDGSRFVLRDYVDAEIFDGLPPGQPLESISLPVQPQGEAVTWTADGEALLVASERDRRLMRVVVPQPTEPSASAESDQPAAQPSETATATSGEGSTELASSSSVPIVPVVLGLLALVAIVVTTVVRSRSRSTR